MSRPWKCKSFRQIQELWALYEVVKSVRIYFKAIGARKSLPVLCNNRSTNSGYEFLKPHSLLLLYLENKLHQYNPFPVSHEFSPSRIINQKGYSSIHPQAVHNFRLLHSTFHGDFSAWLKRKFPPSSQYSSLLCRSTTKLFDFPLHVWSRWEYCS